MRIRTLLNQCQKYKSFSFIKEYVEEVKGESALIVEIDARKNGKPICSCCGKPATQYDRMPTIRDDQFIPIWGYQVYFGFREHETLKIALFHTMGKLPEPKSTHSFF